MEFTQNPINTTSRFRIELTEEVQIVSSAPREIHAYHFSPDRSLFLGSVHIKDIPGALAAITAAVASLGVNLVQSNSCRVSPGVAEWGFFAEAEDGHVSAKGIERTLKASEYVVDCRVRGAEGRVLVDTLHYPLRLSPEAPAILIRKNVFANSLKFMVETLGSGGRALAYQLGKTAGENDGADLIGEIGAPRIIENLPELANLYSAQGWGVPELARFSPRPLDFVIRLHDCFECDGRNSAVPSSHFIRGHIAGMMKAFFGKPVECSETECISKGDPYCEFHCTESLFGR